MRKSPKYECVGDASGGDLGRRRYGEAVTPPDALEEFKRMAELAEAARLKRVQRQRPKYPWTQPPLIPWDTQPHEPWWIPQRTSPRDKTGWICPSCGAPNSPSSSTCSTCRPRRSTIAPTITWSASTGTDHECPNSL